MSLKPEAPAGTVRVDDYVKGELSKDTNWWGAFVVGLAGTILVTGVTPAVLGPLGAAAIPNFIFWALTGGCSVSSSRSSPRCSPTGPAGRPRTRTTRSRTGCRRPPHTSTA